MWNRKLNNMEDGNMDNSSKKVFISYAWAVQTRVVELAERLLANGVNVVLDVYDLKEGQDKYAFMEQSVNDPSVDKVLIVCDRVYVEKANNRSGGVGDETVIITPEVYGNVKQEKLIPVVFEVDEDGKAYIPAYLKGRIYIDLSTEDDRYEVEYEKLLRNIYSKPLYKKPTVGTKSEWLEDDTADLSAIRDLVRQVRGYSGGNAKKAEFLLRKAGDEFVAAAKQFTLPDNKPKDEGLLATIDRTKEYRDIFVDYCESLIYSGIPLEDPIAMLFENLYNELRDDAQKGSYSATDFELYDFMIWEIFIAMTATLLHYEKFSELHSLLVRPYFLMHLLRRDSVEVHNYFSFRAYSRTIEEVCKPKSHEPKRYTMSGDILVHREKKPFLTKESIANADIVLYQLGEILALPPSSERWRWFPTTYVYHSETQPMWQRLVSSSYCAKIAPLFGVDNVQKQRSQL